MAFHVVKGNGFTTVTLYEKTQEEFGNLLRRALNTWNDAPPSMKELHDVVLFDTILQDYRAPNQGNPPKDG